MARDFNGTTGYLLYSGARITTTPLTIACWFNVDAVTVDYELACISLSTNQDRWTLRAAGAATGDRVRAYSIGNGGGNAFAETSAAFTAGAWYHGAAVFGSGAASRTAYINGGSSGSNSTSLTVSSGVNRTVIGARVINLGVGNYVDGRIAEVGFWNVDLTADEVLMLARGISPRFVRPMSLVHYVPVWGRSDPEPDYWNGDAFSLNGTAAQAAHPRIILPAKRHFILLPSASGNVSLAPVDLASAVSLEAASLTQAHQLAPVDLAAAASLEAATLTQAHQLAPVDLGAAVALDDMTVTLAGQASLVDLASAVSIEAMALTQAHQLAPVDLGLSVALDAAGVTQGHVMTPLDLGLSVGIDAMALNAPAADAPSRRVGVVGGSGRLATLLAGSGRLQNRIKPSSRAGLV